jgi:hypothetical protein
MPQQPRILVDREAQGGIMAGTKQEKSKSIDFEAAQEDREESRHEAEEVEQQDLIRAERIQEPTIPRSTVSTGAAPTKRVPKISNQRQDPRKNQSWTRRPTLS